MSNLFKFLAATAGRWTRAIAGLVLIVAGVLAIGGIWGSVVAAIGLVPLAAGVFDFCLFAPLFRLPFSGPSLRAETERQTQAHARA